MGLAPVVVLQERAEARAALYYACVYDDLGEALEALFNYAMDSGVFDEIGPEATAAIINRAFGFKSGDAA